MYLLLALRLVNMSVRTVIYCIYLLSEAIKSGEHKFYNDERERNYLKTKLKDIIPEDKLSNAISYFIKQFHKVTLLYK